MYLRVSLTDRCNLRCVYCLPDNAQFATSRATGVELRRLMALVWAAGKVRKIRLTGGEPTLCEDLPEFISYARSLVNVVGLTTNGVLLEGMLPSLQAAGLNRLNISLDALDGDGFRRFARRDGLDKVVSAIRAAKRFGFAPLKVNVVALPDTDYAGFARFAAWEGVHVRFIELMAIGEARSFQPQAHVTADEMRSRIFAAGVSLSERTDLDEPTARVWTIDNHDATDCSLGFITTVSQPFCATCDRLRLSSQGRLFTCLMDNIGHDLLTPLRAGDEDEVTHRIVNAIAGKRPPSAFIRHENMAAIGG